MSAASGPLPGSPLYPVRAIPGLRCTQHRQSSASAVPSFGGPQYLAVATPTVTGLHCPHPAVPGLRIVVSAVPTLAVLSLSS